MIILGALYLMLSFPFEIKSGLSFEPHAGIILADKEDGDAISGGLRLSYSRSDPTDAFITGELQWTSAWICRNQHQHQWRHFAEGALMLYEIFNPWLIRVGIGGGVQYRRKSYDPVFLGKGSFGYFANSQLGIMLNATTRMIFRDRNSNPLELGLSAQWIF